MNSKKYHMLQKLRIGRLEFQPCYSSTKSTTDLFLLTFSLQRASARALTDHKAVTTNTCSASLR